VSFAGRDPPRKREADLLPSCCFTSGRALIRTAREGGLLFAALKSLMLACGSKEPSGYRTYVEVVAQFPVRVLGPHR